MPERLDGSKPHCIITGNGINFAFLSSSLFPCIHHLPCFLQNFNTTSFLLTRIQTYTARRSHLWISYLTLSRQALRWILQHYKVLVRMVYAIRLLPTPYFRGQNMNIQIMQNLAASLHNTSTGKPYRHNQLPTLCRKSLKSSTHGDLNSISRHVPGFK